MAGNMHLDHGVIKAKQHTFSDNEMRITFYITF
jgi:hypothetical protein